MLVALSGWMLRRMLALIKAVFFAGVLKPNSWALPNHNNSYLATRFPIQEPFHRFLARLLCVIIRLRVPHDATMAEVSGARLNRRTILLCLTIATCFIIECGFFYLFWFEKKIISIGISSGTPPAQLICHSDLYLSAYINNVADTKAPLLRFMNSISHTCARPRQSSTVMSVFLWQARPQPDPSLTNIWPGMLDGQGSVWWPGQAWDRKEDF